MIKGNLAENLIKSSLLLLNKTVHLIQFKRLYYYHDDTVLFRGKIVIILFDRRIFAGKKSINATTVTTQYLLFNRKFTTETQKPMKASVSGIHSHINNYYYHICFSFLRTAFASVTHQ